MSENYGPVFEVADVFVLRILFTSVSLSISYRVVSV